MLKLIETESANFEIQHTDEDGKVTVIARSTSPLPLLRYAADSGIIL